MNIHLSSNSSGITRTIEKLTVFDNKLYFSASSVSGRELWVYDPEDIVSTDATTDNPPRMVADINTTTDGPNDSDPENLTPFDGNLYYCK